MNDLAGSSIACGPAGSAARRACFDFALASGYALGTIPLFHSAQLWHSDDPDAEVLSATIAKWVHFFKTFRSIFTKGTMLHLARPDSRHVEATAYVQHNGTEHGILTLFNPTSRTQRASTAVSLYYADFEPGDKASVTRLPISSDFAQIAGGHLQNDHAPTNSSTHVVGSDGGAAYEIVVQYVMPPRSYAIFIIRKSL